jgi:hypothetical protein
MVGIPRFVEVVACVALIRPIDLALASGVENQLGKIDSPGAVFFPMEARRI